MNSPFPPGDDEPRLPAWNPEAGEVDSIGVPTRTLMLITMAGPVPVRRDFAGCSDDPFSSALTRSSFVPSGSSVSWPGSSPTAN